MTDVYKRIYLLFGPGRSLPRSVVDQLQHGCEVVPRVLTREELKLFRFVTAAPSDAYDIFLFVGPGTELDGKLWSALSSLGVFIEKLDAQSESALLEMTKTPVPQPLPNLPVNISA
jgi:hypothetical protein